MIIISNILLNDFHQHQRLARKTFRSTLLDMNTPLLVPLSRDLRVSTHSVRVAIDGHRTGYPRFRRWSSRVFVQTIAVKHKRLQFRGQVSSYTFTDRMLGVSFCLKYLLLTFVIVSQIPPSCI